MPENRCLFSHVAVVTVDRSSDTGAGRSDGRPVAGNGGSYSDSPWRNGSAVGSALLAGDPGGALVVDGDERTGLALSGDGSEAVEVRFIGAPRWINRIEVLADAQAHEIQVLALDGTWTLWPTRGPGAGPGRLPGYGNGDGAEFMSGPGVYVQGLRFVPRSAAGEPAGVVRLEEIRAFFDGTDPDKLDAVGGPASARDPMAPGYNYHSDWVNRYPGEGNDLSECDDDAKGLRDALPGTWDKWLHGNYDAWEEHFKRTDLGGTNASHVDDSDLSYFSGHGTTSTDTDGDDARALYFGDDDHDDQCLVPGEARGAWDGDMEWVGFASCQTMRSCDRWFQAMDGVHLILGWLTNMKDVNLGEDFGDYMVDNGWFDSAERIKTAWFDAAEDSHGDGYTAYVVGETSDMGRDYLHGEGTVQDDPVHNCCYHWWSYSTCGGIFCREASAPDPVMDPVRFEGGAGGFPVLVDRAVLAQPRQDAMPVYNVVPVSVDETYVRSIANAICQVGGPFCSGEIGPGDPGHLNLIDGEDELRVCQETGSMHYHDSGTWFEWQTSQPQLLSESASILLAEQILTSIGRRRQDAVVDRVDFAWQGARFAPETGPASDIPESTYAVATRVVYKRHLSGFPVAGPGGSMTVAFGGGGLIQRIFEGGWRQAVPGPTVGIIPVTSAIQFLADRGSDGTVDGIMPVVHALQIDSWELGYYEHSCDEAQSTIRPVYIFDCTIFESDPSMPNVITSHDKIHVWAEALPPVPQIVAPDPGTCITPGEEICFAGTGTGGISPLSFEWRDDIVGEIGSGPNMCAVLPSPPLGHEYSESLRVVQLTVRDALGREGHASIDICIAPATGVEPDAVAGQPLIELVLPNPTDGLARVRVHAPVRGEYRLEVFDVAGRRVRSLDLKANGAETLTFEWDGRTDSRARVGAGTYFARVTGPRGSEVREIVRVR